VKVDYTAIAAWAAVVAALAAIVAIWTEGKRARFSQGLELLLRLDEEFDSEEFKKKRRAVAKLLLKEEENFEKGKRLEEVEDILNHFQIIGFLLRKGVLDKELVWVHFFFWLNHYYLFLKPHIASVREWEPTAWEDVDWLHRRLAVLERKHRPKGMSIQPTDEMIREFLTRESAL